MYGLQKEIAGNTIVIRNNYLSQVSLYKRRRLMLLLGLEAHDYLHLSDFSFCLSLCTNRGSQVKDVLLLSLKVKDFK